MGEKISNNDLVDALDALMQAGAEKRGSAYVWPFYKANGETEMLQVGDWIRRRQEAARELEQLRKRERDALRLLSQITTIARPDQYFVAQCQEWIKQTTQKQEK